MENDVNELIYYTTHLEKCFESPEVKHPLESSAEDLLEKWMELGKKLRSFDPKPGPHANWMLRRSPELKAQFAEAQVRSLNSAYP